jgi:hypothetical protein
MAAAQYASITAPMSKSTNAKRTKGASAPKPSADVGDVALTLRVPKELLAKIDAKVERLNAKKMGRWSRNAYLVHVLGTAAEDTHDEK